MKSTQTTYTPGPWSMDDEYNVYDVPTDGDALSIHVDNMDDARLIAAAPELLEALRTFVNAVKDRQFGDIKSAVDQQTFDAYCLAKQAIAKAEGK